MATEYYANNATTTLSGTITSGATSLVVQSVSSFPANPQFRLLIDAELLLTTGLTGNTLAVSRAIEGTTAAAHTSGATVAQVVTSGSLIALATKTTPFVLASEIISSEYSWVNQGDATVTQSGPGIVIRAPASTTASVRLFLKSLPVVSGYTFIAPIWYTGPGSTVSCGGLVLRDSGGTTFTALSLLENGTVEIQKWNSPTSFNSTYTTDSTPNWHNYGKPIYLRLQDDGANRTYSLSQEGTVYKVIHTVSRTDFITPNQFGFMLNPEQTGNDRLASFFSYSFSTP